MRRAQWLAATAAAATLATVGAPAARPLGGTQELPPELQLAQRFSPVLLIGNTGSVCATRLKNRFDPYEPIEVEIVLRNPRPHARTVLRRDDSRRENGDSVLLVGGTPSAVDLGANAARENYVDVVGSSPASCRAYFGAYYALASHYRRVTYATVVPVARGPCSAGDRLRVRYWFFYFYNSWWNAHEGDWEHVELFFDSSDAAALVREGRTPTSVRYASHGDAQGGCRAWTDPGVAKTGLHPKVYVARGSHASYFQPEPRKFFGGLARDWPPRERDARVVVPEVVWRPTACSDPAVASGPFAWVRFGGRWGEEVDADDARKTYRIPGTRRTITIPANRSSGPHLKELCA